MPPGARLRGPVSDQLADCVTSPLSGLTEASPTCFNAHTYDTVDRRLTTVGTVLPHAHSKIVDRDGRILPVGQRGELCMAGYQLQRGYWNNPEKTDECMIRDEQGILWLHTGDEAVFDENGYCTITGRFKDIIIRGKRPNHLPCHCILPCISG